MCSTARTSVEQEANVQRYVNHFESGTCLTDKLAAFLLSSSMSGAASISREILMKRFCEFTHADPAAMNK